MEEKELAVMPQQNQVTTINFFGGVEIFKEGWNMAGVLADSDLVPAHFRGKKANCLIALNMAQRMKADPLMVMQNLVVVHGTPTFEAKFAIACFNATGRYSPIRYREVGEKGKDSWGYVAYAIEKATGDICEGPLVTIATAKGEGWYNQNPKWKNVPELMLRYRAASWFIRTTDPGVMMGFQTREEVEDYADYEEVKDDVTETPKDANSETLEVPKDEPNTTANNGASNEKKEETAKPKEPKTATEPLGKQETPDIFQK